MANKPPDTQATENTTEPEKTTAPEAAAATPPPSGPESIARMKCYVNRVNGDGPHPRVVLFPLHDNSIPDAIRIHPSAPNGEIMLELVNEVIAGQFGVGREFFIDVTPVE